MFPSSTMTEDHDERSDDCRPPFLRAPEREGKAGVLQALSDVVCDIQSELAPAEAERAALTGSLEADLQRVLGVRDVGH